MAANDAVSMNVAENRQNVPMAIQENRAAVPMTVAEGGGTPGGLNRKADKVVGAVAGNLAGLDANGNLTDSGKAPGDFLEAPATAGSEGQVLTADGEGGASWQDPTGGDPTEIIDDTAGDGDTDKVWSADKSHELLTEINSKADEPTGTKTAGKVYGLDSNLNPAWVDGGGGSVDPAVIEQKVDEWLDTNITNPESPPLDRSLSSSSAAAPADLAGEIKEKAKSLAKSFVYPFAIVDSRGKSIFTVDEDGFIDFLQRYIKLEDTGISHTDAQGNKKEEFRSNAMYDFALVDQYFRAMFYVQDGELRIKGVNADYINAGVINNNQIAYLTNMLKKIETDHYKDGNFDSEINMFICYGQSWAEGYDAHAITLSQRYDNIMLNTGIRNEPLSSIDQTATSFIPMVEVDGTSSGTGTQLVGETPVSAQSNMIKQLIEAENGYKYTDFPYQIIGTSPGYGSTTLVELKKGTSYYTRLIAQVQMAYNIASAMNKKLVVQAFSWAQGSLGAGATGTYAENLEQLRLDIDGDVKAITGQTQDVKCITWQGFLYTANAAKDFYDRYVGASETYPNIICSGATYHLDNVAANNLHFTSESQDWLGAYFGIAYKRSIIDGEKFIPLKPISASHLGNILYVKFNVPKGPLVIDTERVAEADNYGFNLYDSSNNEKQIDSVEIISPDTIKIVCESSIATTDKLTYSQNAGAAWGRETGNRGNIRDSQGEYITYESGNGLILPMHNWCVVFSKTVSEMEE